MQDIDNERQARQATLLEALNALEVQPAEIEHRRARKRYELLLRHALDASAGDYGIVLSPAGDGAYAEQFVKLGAAVERDDYGQIRACHDTLVERRIDALTASTMRRGQSLQGKPTEIGLPQCLPNSHPSIRNFLMVPLHVGVSPSSILFLANLNSPGAEHDQEAVMARVEQLCQVFSSRLSEAWLAEEETLHSAIPGAGARHYVNLMNASLNAVVIVNTKGEITAFNPAAEELFGRSCVQALGTHLERYLPAEYLTSVLKRASGLSEASEPRSVQSSHSRPLTAVNEIGDSLQLQSTSFFTRIGSTVYTTFVFEHESANPALAETNTGHQQFRALTNVAPVGIVQLSADWTCEYANDMWCQLSGLGQDESIGEGWIDALYAEDMVDALVELREALNEDRIFHKNIRLQRPTGGISWVTLSGTAMVNEAGSFAGCLLVLLDVTESHEANERLRYSASHDVLTGLANRKSFLDELQCRLDDPRTRIDTALLYLDLDGFKVVNDTLGHDCGDELLRQVAQRLQKTLLDTDRCARLGGDEFTVILCSSLSMDEIGQVAETILQIFKQPFEVFDNKLHLSTSIGVAIADEKITCSDRLIKQADTALYKAKGLGRSRWVMYTQAIHAEDEKRTALSARIRQACEKHEFSLVYQPQFRIDGHAIVGLEALLRWNPCDRLSPDTRLLISVLEESGLINDTGQWVLEHACQQFRRWLDQSLLDETCTISVNVSPAQLTLANFSSRLHGIIERSALLPQNLCIEITESALIENGSNCIPVMHEIKSMGVQLTLDDFGTGYASLSYLARLPIDRLKIDRSFIMAMNSDNLSRTIVMAVLALADSLNITVIAEGIENAITLESLSEAGCKFGQGFLMSKPLPVDELESLLQREGSSGLGQMEPA